MVGGRKEGGLVERKVKRKGLNKWKVSQIELESKNRFGTTRVKWLIFPVKVPVDEHSQALLPLTSNFVIYCQGTPSKSCFHHKVRQSCLRSRSDLYSDSLHSSTQMSSF